MLEVELDIFSGMPNPTWVLSKRQETTLYELLSAEPNQISPVTTLDKRFGLGYRGLIVRRIKSDDGAWDKAMSARRVPFTCTDAGVMMGEVWLLSAGGVRLTSMEAATAWGTVAEVQR